MLDSFARNSSLLESLKLEDISSSAEKSIDLGILGQKAIGVKVHRSNLAKQMEDYRRSLSKENVARTDSPRW